VCHKVQLRKVVLGDDLFCASPRRTAARRGAHASNAGLGGTREIGVNPEMGALEQERLMGRGGTKLMQLATGTQRHVNSPGQILPLHPRGAFGTGRNVIP